MPVITSKEELIQIIYTDLKDGGEKAITKVPWKELLPKIKERDINIDETKLRNMWQYSLKEQV